MTVIVYCIAAAVSFFAGFVFSCLSCDTCRRSFRRRESRRRLKEKRDNNDQL